MRECWHSLAQALPAVGPWAEAGVLSQMGEGICDLWFPLQLKTRAQNSTGGSEGALGRCLWGRGLWGSRKRRDCEIVAYAWEKGGRWMYLLRPVGEGREVDVQSFGGKERSGGSSHIDELGDFPIWPAPLWGLQRH